MTPAPSVTNQKASIREVLRSIRENISPLERERAALHLFEALRRITNKYSLVLSYASFSSEIDTWPLNYHLATKERLLLPQLQGDKIRIFKVTDIDNQLKTSPYGIMEPIPELCAEVFLSTIPFAIIPGLGFDSQNNRLGYGKGCYDRILCKMPACLTCGTGFTQQLVGSLLPTTKKDIPLKGCRLF
ncbi:MAG: 5-formyltetrahydrofolate cyclo-ligase [Chlamydiales bacterium]|jgi:5-formyltetrahydrofolate cyclo-ligase